MHQYPKRKRLVTPIYALQLWLISQSENEWLMLNKLKISFLHQEIPYVRVLFVKLTILCHRHVIQLVLSGQISEIWIPFSPVRSARFLDHHNLLFSSPFWNSIHWKQFSFLITGKLWKNGLNYNSHVLSAHHRICVKNWSPVPCNQVFAHFYYYCGISHRCHLRCS